MASAANVLSRKLRQGGVARSPLPDGDLIGETFARGVEDRLRPLVKTMIVARVTGIRITKLGEATGRIAAPAMLGVVEVEDADTPALICADSDLANHLIDLTLGGDPGCAGEVISRGFTAIDMSLCRLHLEAILQAFTQAIGASLGRPLVKELRIREQRQNLSQMRLAPDYIDVLVLGLELAFGEAGRRGGFSLILPLSALDVIRASVQEHTTQAARERPNDLWKTLMRRAAAAAPVPVRAVLFRQPLSLAALGALQVGQVLEIPRQATDEIALAIAQPGGRTAVLATGKLGAFQGHKVVKLATAPDQRMLAHLEAALRASPVRSLAAAAATRPPEAVDAVPQDPC